MRFVIRLDVFVDIVDKKTEVGKLILYGLIRAIEGQLHFAGAKIQCELGYLLLLEQRDHFGIFHRIAVAGRGQHDRNNHHQQQNQQNNAKIAFIFLQKIISSHESRGVGTR